MPDQGRSAASAKQLTLGGHPYAKLPTVEEMTLSSRHLKHLFPDARERSRGDLRS